MKRPVIIYFFLMALVLSFGLVTPHEAGAITIQEEEAMSKEFLKVVANYFPLLKDPVISEYVDSVGKKIAATLPPQPFDFHFHVIREDTYNAFATPAGHIFINSGLLAALESESELAGILAHEIAHVVCRHISSKIDRGKKLQMATLAGMVAGIFLGVSGNAEAAQAMTTGSMAAGQALTLAYSREDERQADQLGLRYLQAAGYDAGGLMSGLEKIRSKNWFGSSQIPTYLTTHPGVEERIATIGAWKAREENQKLETKGPSNDFSRAHMRLLAVYGEKDIVGRQLDNALASNPESPWALYGKGLFLARNGNTADAIGFLKAALEKRAFDAYLLSDLGGLYYQAGMLADAATSVESALGIRPDLTEALMLLGRTRLEMENPDAAVEALKKLTRLDPDYPQAHFYLAKAYGELGYPARAHYHLGVHYRNSHNRKNAMFHLKRAREANAGADAELENKIDELLGSLGKEKPEQANKDEDSE